MNAPATFQRMMDDLLRELQYARVYFDDIVIFSSYFSSYMQHVKMVQNRISVAGIKWKLKKCRFVQTKIHLLGHVVSEQGIAVNHEKTSAIAKASIPASKTEHLSFLGLAPYY